MYRKLYRFIRKVSYYLLKHYSGSNSIIPSVMAIDVGIMVLEKDLEILPLCIKGIRKHIRNKINNIYIICPSSDVIKKYCIDYNLKYVEESSVLGYGPRDLDIVVKSRNDTLNRSGWLFQQLVKLSGNIGDSQHVLFIDSDHILIKDHVFLTSEDKTVYYMSKEFHLPYYNNMKKLLRKKLLVPPALSFVSHKMLFDKDKLKELHRIVEMNNGEGKKWDKIIIESYDKKQESGFSEFELYGYMFGDDGIWLPWEETRLNYTQKESYDVLENKYKSFKSVTFPSFIN